MGWLHDPFGVGVPNASKHGSQSLVAHKLGAMPHNPCRPAVAQCSGVGVGGQNG